MKTSLFLLMTAGWSAITTTTITTTMAQETQEEDGFPPVPTDYEEPITSYDCDVSCRDTEFCGSDLECHEYSCEAWYEYAHPFFTGRGEGIADAIIPFQCQSVVDDQNRIFLQRSNVCLDKAPLAVEFLGSDATAASSCYDEFKQGQLAVLSFHRKCFARPSQETGFVCYDNHGTNEDELVIPATAAYVNETQALGSSGNHSYKLYVSGYSLQYDEEQNYSYPSIIGEFRQLWGNSKEDPFVFNATAANAAMYSEAFPLNLDPPVSNDDCDVEYGGCLLNEFCGNDGQCHVIDCIHFWKYGPAEFTGRLQQDEDNNNAAASLQCGFVVPPQNSTTPNNAITTNFPCTSDGSTTPFFPTAVQYKCHPENRFYLDVDYCRNDARTLPFYRMCTGRPNPAQDFVCFDMGEMNDMDLQAYAQPYIQEISDNPDCTDQDLPPFYTPQPDDPPLVAHHHQTHRIQRQGLDTSLLYASPYRDASREPLDLKLLQQAMLSRLEGSPPPPDDNDDDLEDSSATMCSSSLRIVAGSLLSLLLASAAV